VSPGEERLPGRTLQDPAAQPQASSEDARIRDPHGHLAALADRAARGESVILELGSGGRKDRPDSIAIDVRDVPGVDIVGDVFDVLAAVPSGTVTELYSSHFLEHVDGLERLLGEFARVLRPGGVVTAIVPHFANPWFWSDPTHERSFGLYTLSYLVRDAVLRRRVPHYSAELPPLSLAAVRLAFKPRKNRWLRRAWCHVVESLVNLGPRPQEFHEAHLCWVLPCYELHYRLVRDET
jgi:SAM-dependent methyltransferase